MPFDGENELGRKGPPQAWLCAASYLPTVSLAPHPVTKASQGSSALFILMMMTFGPSSRSKPKPKAQWLAGFDVADYRSERGVATGSANPAAY